MSDKANPKSSESAADTFVVDGRYLRDQAIEALKLFVAPLSGVYAAAFGPTSTVADTNGQKKSGRN